MDMTNTSIGWSWNATSTVGIQLTTTKTTNVIKKSEEVVNVSVMKAIMCKGVVIQVGLDRGTRNLSTQLADRSHTDTEHD